MGGIDGLITVAIRRLHGSASTNVWGQRRLAERLELLIKIAGMNKL
jgi:hypothetical protein